MSTLRTTTGLPGGRGLRLLAKRLAYATGALDLVHRRRNRDNLTVAMFHRVLPASDPRSAGADPEWTMTPDTFSHCLDFFARHYSVVTPEQVNAALRGELALPPRSLLITFDDGWADTAQFAQPLLDRAGFKALVFVAGSAVDSTAAFWEEQVFSAIADPAVPQAALARALHGAGLGDSPDQMPVGRDEAGARRLIGQLSALDRQRALAVVAQLPAPAYPPAMMTAQQVRDLAQAGHGIGGHGMLHCPLTKAASLDAELGAAMRTLTGHLGAPVETMSFPHGAYNADIIDGCRAAGYRYLFSSDACLTPMAGPAAEVPLVGRIHISERALHSGGRFLPALLALELFLRPVRRLQADRGPANG